MLAHIKGNTYMHVIVLTRSIARPRSSAYTDNMDEQLRQAVEQLNKKIDAVYASVEQTRKYFLWTLIISALVVVLPLIGLALVIPSFLDLYSGLSGL